MALGASAVALVVSIGSVALVVSIGSVLYGRREALAAEESNWLTHPMDFSVSVANAHTGAARLVIVYVAGLPLAPIIHQMT